MTETWDSHHRVRKEGPRGRELAKGSPVLCTEPHSFGPALGRVCTEAQNPDVHPGPDPDPGDVGLPQT